MKLGLMALMFLALVGGGTYVGNAIAGDDRGAKGWHDDDRGHHSHRSTLIVDLDKGTVDVGDPCPMPRTSALYLKISAAIECAESGHTIKVRPGRYTEAEISIFEGNVRIVGSGTNQTIVSGVGGFTVFGGKAVIENLTIASGNAFDGGGFDNEPDGEVVIKNCVFAGNDAVTGGGLVNYGKMRIHNSVFVNNEGKPRGGAIANFGDLMILHTTIVGNTAETGGGIFNSGAGSLTVVKSLISDNEGAGIYNESTGTLELIRTVLEGNSPADCFGCP